MAFALRQVRGMHTGILRWTDSARAGLEDSVGKTPLIYLKSISKEIGRNIVAKAELMNPGASVKDRAALFLIKDAEERGLLKPGGTVVEGTAGNTGIGLAHICNAKGYKCVIYMPNTQSQEKIQTLVTLGADVRAVPAVAFDNPMNYNHQAKRFAESIENAVWTNQFDNVANKRAHIETTGPEIWMQTNGKIDGFTCATGTGGTLAGVATYLKSKNPFVRIVLADPPGSVLHHYFQTGILGVREGSSVTEGIGQGRVTDNLKDAPIDGSVRIPDEVSINMVFRLLYEEGLCVGSSSGLNVAAAVEVAKQLPEGSTVATILCDSGFRYASKLFSKQWMESKNLVTCIPEKYRGSLV